MPITLNLTKKYFCHQFLCLLVFRKDDKEVAENGDITTVSNGKTNPGFVSEQYNINNTHL